MSLYARMSQGVFWRAAVWTVASVLFLDVALGRIRDLHAAGRYVSPWRYAQVGFWGVMLCFWLIAGIRNWRATRGGRTVV